MNMSSNNFTINSNNDPEIQIQLKRKYNEENELKKKKKYHKKFNSMNSLLLKIIKLVSPCKLVNYLIEMFELI